MIEIITCSNCNSVISTSINISFLSLRFGNDVISSICINPAKEKIFFIVDDDELSQIINSPFEFEYILIKNEIKCKNCGATVGSYSKNGTIIVGLLFLSNIIIIEEKNNIPKEIGINSQIECETLTTMKEVRNLSDILSAYSKEVTFEDIGEIKAEISNLSNKINSSEFRFILEDNDILTNK